MNGTRLRASEAREARGFVLDEFLMSFPVCDALNFLQRQALRNLARRFCFDF
jgi:hypothetical protein